ncbi:hypothetical protein BHE74_00038470 [Ensete ventricosum]|nr:hypothetical protein BHE74_00038470 [Ensete ventricosum]RZR80534.1 hypothetical protein BHM03_00006606 [Ensete ventricosum]
MRRLDNLIHQLNPISEQVNVIKRNKLLYHKAFANRCNNLRTAEAEVDLLGDELDLLFGLLEKIYIALDHYSPVLQHYSGVINFLFEVTFIFFFFFFALFSIVLMLFCLALLNFFLFLLYYVCKFFYLKQQANWSIVIMNLGLIVKFLFS